ncbi:MAG: single-stranded-DNA-specific exonuclease RecJ [Candidatus Omnitrophica bacterium]|nr:single-stranded-DNA-specific exonuclease RecJ [Candidatus Omnitrophota bacterium]
MKQQVWKIKDIDPKAKIIAGKANLPIHLIQVLLNRGIKPADFDSFLQSSIEQLHSPLLLPDIEKASQRILSAIKSKQKVLVFGDYDVDGITSLAIFNQFAKGHKDVFKFYIPHRIKEGYGLNTQAILKAKEERVSLIIAFDCGTNATAEVELARSLGIDMIVVDHHLIKDKIYPFAFINPQRDDFPYPFAHLSSGAISFKLLQVLTGSSCIEVLDLVALSIVCDVVPLKGENRVLLKEGLKVLKKTDRLAIKALCSVAKLKQTNIDTFHIGYILGPRINASGRVAHAKSSLELFFTDDSQEAQELAAKLGEYNSLRRNIENQILKEAEQKISHDFSDKNTIVVSGENWHPGVLGIVASRLADKYQKPSFVISFDQGKGVGSARSVAGVHLIQMLDLCAESLLAYGGHKKAAGVHIHKDELENFKDKINSIIEENIKPEDFMPVIDIDARLDFSEIDPELAQIMESLKPWGEANKKPLFASFSLTKKSQPRKISFGYSLWLSNGKYTHEAVIFDKDLLEIVNYAEKLDIVFSLDFNTYHNIPRITVKDCRISDYQEK